jgi:hypothetical protein
MVERRAPGPAAPGTDLRVLKTYVPVESWHDVMDRAEKAGLSVSRYIRALIDRDELDADGRPVWIDPALSSTSTEPLPGMDPAAA